MAGAAAVGWVKFSAVILAGGQSTRMGRDKAWLTWNGQPLLARQIATVRELGPVELFISGRADTDYSSLGCPVLQDAWPGAGPLAGIATGLEAATAPLVLVLAVDMPEMTSGLLRELLGRCRQAVGVVPRVGRGLEPLAAFYPKATAPLALDLLQRQLRAVRTFAERCQQAGLVVVHDVAEAEWKYFANWNAPNDRPLAGE